MLLLTLLSSIAFGATPVPAPVITPAEVVGPFPVVVFTDASMFSSQIYINGSAIKMDNKDGSGFGYHMKKVANAYLHSGTNKIEAEFELTSKCLENPACMSGARESSYAFYVVQGGTKRFEWEYSYERKKLESAFAKSTADFKVLHSESKVYGPKAPPTKTVRVSYVLTIDKGWKIAKADAKKCEWGTMKPFQTVGSHTEFTASAVGTYSANGQAIEDFQAGHGKILAPFDAKSDANTLEYKVSSLGPSPEKFQVTYTCRLGDALKAVSSPNLEQFQMDLADLGDERVEIVWDVMITKPGDYKSGFTFKP